jgi:hypothetical protein
MSINTDAASTETRLAAERAILEQTANAQSIATTRSNQADGTKHAYTPKQLEYSSWCVDPTKGRYPDDIVSELKLKRFLTEEQVIIKDGVVKGGREVRPRGRKPKVVEEVVVVEEDIIDDTQESIERADEEVEEEEVDAGNVINAFLEEFGDEDADVGGCVDAEVPLKVNNL